MPRDPEGPSAVLLKLILGMSVGDLLHDGGRERFPMKRFVISRLLLGLTTVLGVSVLVFSMLHLVPGDPVTVLQRHYGSGEIDPEVIRERLGLNDPLPVQYWRFLSGAVRGDLGKAIFIKLPVTTVILQELPYTIRLAAAGWVLIVVFGLVFGISSALTVGTWLDSAISALVVSGLSIPSFWLAMLFIMLFSVKLDWLPIFGDESLKVLIMPAFVLGFRSSALVSRMTRSGLLEVLGEDYIRTARAKGLRERVVIVRHALKNALIPVVTLLGLEVGYLLGGAVVVEVVFARRGIGNVAMRAILSRDYPLAQGMVLFVAVAFVLVNIVTDLVYGYIDPRIRYE